MKKKKLYKLDPRYAPSKPTPKLAAPEVQTTPEAKELGDARVREIWKQISGRQSDWPLAGKVAKLELTIHGTVPELIAYLWLEERGEQFYSQAAVGGGRTTFGGVVPDFVIDQGGHGIAWLINGEYFHSEKFQLEHGQEGRDQRAVLLLRGSYFHGIRIDQVVILWEDRVYDSRPQVFELGLQGVGMRE